MFDMIVNRILASCELGLRLDNFFRLLFILAKIIILKIVSSSSSASTEDAVVSVGTMESSGSTTVLEGTTTVPTGTCGAYRGRCTSCSRNSGGIWERTLCTSGGRVERWEEARLVMSISC